MKHLLLCSLLGLFSGIALAQTETLHEDWEVASIGNGIKPSFDFDAEGNIHVMGMTEAGNGIVWYAQADRLSGPWQPVIQSVGYYYGPGDLRIDPGGTVHINVHDHDAPDNLHLAIPPAGPTLARRISGAGHDGWDGALAIGPSGELHLASINPSDFGAVHSLEYGRFDGTNWTFDAGLLNSGAGMYGLNTTLAIDSNGRPHAAFCASGRWVSDGSLRYATQNNSGVWQFSNVVSGIGTGRFPSLALDSSNRVHLAWMDVHATVTTQAIIKYAVLLPGGWAIQTIDTLNRVFMDNMGARKSVSLALDANGTPHLAYSDQGVVKYAVLKDRWDITPVLQHDTDTYNGLVVLRLDPLDQPGVIFWQETGGTPGLIRMTRPRPHFKMSAITRSADTLEFTWGNPGHTFSYVVECNEDLSDTNGWVNISGTPMQGFSWMTNTTSQAAYYRVRAVEE